MIYNEDVAFQYRAYRPPLHRVILKECFTGIGHVAKGLDVGCGTGHSAAALAKYCDSVDGIDSSQSMIDHATAYPGVNYYCSSLFEMAFESHSYDVITFAGSLYYQKSQKTLDELTRITKKEAFIITYDFELYAGIFDSILPPPNNPMEYDHQLDFSGLNHPSLKKLISKAKRVKFKISRKDLAHLLLSSSESLEAARHLFSDDLHRKMKKEIKIINARVPYILEADIFYSIYQFLPNEST